MKNELRSIFKNLQGGQLYHLYRKSDPLQVNKFEMRPGGRGACEIDIWSTGEMYRDWPEGGLFVYRREDLEQMLRNAQPPERLIKLSIDFQHELACWMPNTSYGAVGSIDPGTLYLMDREDGETVLRGMAEWNPIGMSLLQNGQARYISPAIIANARRTRRSAGGPAGEEIGYALFNVGLVTEPFNDTLQEVSVPLGYSSRFKVREYKGNKTSKVGLTTNKLSSSLYQKIRAQGLRAFALEVAPMDWEKYKTFLTDLFKAAGMEEAKAIELADKAVAECKAMMGAGEAAAEESTTEESATVADAGTTATATASKKAAQPSAFANDALASHPVIVALNQNQERIYGALNRLLERTEQSTAQNSAAQQASAEAAAKAKKDADAVIFSADKKAGKHFYFLNEKDALDTFNSNRAEYDRTVNRAPAIQLHGSHFSTGDDFAGAPKITKPGVPAAPANLPTAADLGVSYAEVDPFSKDGADVHKLILADMAAFAKANPGKPENSPGNTYNDAAQRVSRELYKLKPQNGVAR